MAVVPGATNVKVVKDNWPALKKSLSALGQKRVMVGVPSETNYRDDEEHEVGNADLGFIHEFGAPEANIPARPFLIPGIREAQKQLIPLLKAAGAVAAARGSVEAVDAALHRVGLTAQAAVRRYLTTATFVPLAESTVRGRINRRQSATWRAAKHAAVDANIAAGSSPQEGLFKPLIDTGQLRQAITYVLRKKK